MYSVVAKVDVTTWVLTTISAVAKTKRKQRDSSENVNAEFRKWLQRLIADDVSLTGDIRKDGRSRLHRGHFETR